ncbi:MAG: hypothetical protein NVS3B10_02060 [Polyangiales bacterium]
MSTRRRRLALGAASLGLVAVSAACVDLFHSTEFDTLCIKSPDDPACVVTEDAGADVIVAEAEAGPTRPDFCSWSSTEAQAQAMRACAWLGACERPLGESLFGACVVHAQLAFDCTANPSLRPRNYIDGFWTCLATVHSCADVDQCVFPSGVQECVAVAGGTSTACGTNGNTGVRLECQGDAGRAHGVEPCALTGRTCATTSDKSIAKCSGRLGFGCTGDGGKCDDTSAVDCEPAGLLHIDQGIDCSGYGAGQCAAGEAGPACMPTITSTPTVCTEDAHPACQGAVVRTCIAGQEIRIDCAALGLSCDATQASTADPSAGCVKRGVGACTGTDVCPTSSTLRSCGRGATFTVDCASVGLGKCLIDTAGNGACSPPP